MTTVLQPSRAVALLQSRKEALEQMIRERFRVARERGGGRQALKRQIAATAGRRHRTSQTQKEIRHAKSF
jgi:hypothetical protein